MCALRLNRNQFSSSLHPWIKSFNTQLHTSLKVQFYHFLQLSKANVLPSPCEVHILQYFDLQELPRSIQNVKGTEICGRVLHYHTHKKKIP